MFFTKEYELHQEGKIQKQYFVVKNKCVDQMINNFDDYKTTNIIYHLVPKITGNALKVTGLLLLL